jgi:hypothetical protein
MSPTSACRVQLEPETYTLDLTCNPTAFQRVPGPPPRSAARSWRGDRPHQLGSSEAAGSCCTTSLSIS